MISAGFVHDSSPVYLPALEAENTLRRVFYPMGFPLMVETNTDEILSLAAEIWPSHRTMQRQRPACLLQLNLRRTGAFLVPHAPRLQRRGLLTYLNAGEENFAVCDFGGGFAVGWVNEAAVEHGRYLQEQFLRPVATQMLAQEAHLYAPALRNGGTVVEMKVQPRLYYPDLLTGTHG